jgi:hypothetical protein
VSTPNDVDLSQPRPPLTELLGVRDFRKKPLVVQAVRFENEQMGSLLAEWCGGTNDAAPDLVEIPTLEGIMEVQLGDWIVRGIAGEFYPVQADIFDATFDLVWPT